jgi:hypothetical protein
MSAHGGPQALDYAVGFKRGTADTTRQVIRCPTPLPGKAQPVLDPNCSRDDSKDFPNNHIDRGKYALATLPVTCGFERESPSLVGLDRLGGQSDVALPSIARIVDDRATYHGCCRLQMIGMCETIKWRHKSTRIDECDGVDS